MPPALRKPVEFVPGARDEIRTFPKDTLVAAGYQLMRVQNGDMPDDYDTLPEVGPGVTEIRLWGDGMTYRVFYVARFAEAVYVLHCFEKKAKKGRATPQAPIRLAKARYKSLTHARSQTP
jgi:phage-related protein